ncbi:transcriptional regulator [Pseudomonas sp.]|uniref:transcriptional regulator n=1 Tax=Pseudomonas sp. TaxID=306 RepID=UPI003F319CA5
MLGLSGIGNLFAPPLSPQAVYKWLSAGVPAGRVLAVCEATGWQVTPHVLRPDIYPNPSDGLPASGGGANLHGTNNPDREAA